MQNPTMAQAGFVKEYGEKVRGLFESKGKIKMKKAELGTGKRTNEPGRRSSLRSAGNKVEETELRTMDHAVDQLALR